MSSFRDYLFCKEIASCIRTNCYLYSLSVSLINSNHTSLWKCKQEQLDRYCSHETSHAAKMDAICLHNVIILGSSCSCISRYFFVLSSFDFKMVFAQLSVISRSPPYSFSKLKLSAFTRPQVMLMTCCLKRPVLVVHLIIRRPLPWQSSSSLCRLGSFPSTLPFLGNATDCSLSQESFFLKYFILSLLGGVILTNENAA